MCSVDYLSLAQLSKFKVSQVRNQNCSHSKTQLSKTGRVFSAVFTCAFAGSERNFDCWGHSGFRNSIKGAGAAAGADGLKKKIHTANTQLLLLFPHNWTNPRWPKTFFSPIKHCVHVHARHDQIFFFI